MNVAVLGSLDVPTVSYFVQSFRNCGYAPEVFLSRKREAAKDIEIWNDRTKGRFPPIALNKETVTLLDTFSSDEATAFLQRFDIAVNGGVLEILKGRVLVTPKCGILNLHPGVLPKYRGSTPVEWALLNGDCPGVTAHLLDDRIDTGPIVAVQYVKVSPAMSYVDIRCRIFEVAFELAPKAAEGVVSGLITPIPQGEGTYWRPIPDDKLTEVKARYAGRL